MSQWGSIATLVADVQAGKCTASELVDRALKTIDEKQDFNAVIAPIHERARERAKQIDKQIKQDKTPGRLAGVPFIAKDNFLTFGSETTAASNILKGFEAPYQATSVERLEAEGAICVAKANMDAFAHGSTTENSDFMVTKNPYDMTKVPGGSSGGSAAAVILEMVPFALGTDTGGSNRLPASFCGAVGLRPTYGLVSRSGVVAMASSTDVIGPLTRTVEDNALVLDVMAGGDDLDATTIEPDPAGYVLPANDGFSVKDIHIGLIKEFMSDDVSQEVKDRILQAADKLAKAGARISEVSLPSVNLALACYYIIVPAEISSNLSRYDGQRYGFSHPKATSIDESYYWSRSEGFGKEAKRRIMIGTYVLSTGYYDAYYRRAQQVRTKLIDEFNHAFDNQKLDFLMSPTAPATAFPIGAKADNPMQMYLTDAMTTPASLVNIPAISIPAGKANGMPVGLQFMGQWKKDWHLLEMARKTEEILTMKNTKQQSVRLGEAI